MIAGPRGRDFTPLRQIRGLGRLDPEDSRAPSSACTPNVISGGDLQHAYWRGQLPIPPTETQVSRVQRTPDKPPIAEIAAWQGSDNPVETSFSEHINMGPAAADHGSLFSSSFQRHLIWQ